MLNSERGISALEVHILYCMVDLCIHSFPVPNSFFSVLRTDRISVLIIMYRLPILYLVSRGIIGFFGDLFPLKASLGSLSITA